MITAYYSSILDQPVDRVWGMVRDFNNYPVYIDGVTESLGMSRSMLKLEGRRCSP